MSGQLSAVMPCAGQPTSASIRTWHQLVTVTNHLSLSEHVQDVISMRGESIYALKVLQNHNMNDGTLMDIFYKSVVLAKVFYTSTAWWGFSLPSDKQCIRLLRYLAWSIADWWSYADATRWWHRWRILANEHHVLEQLLTDIKDHAYSFQLQWHNLSLSVNTDDQNL